MKSLIKTLFIICLFFSVVSCKPSTEEKMLKALQTEQFGKKMHIESLTIIDTLFEKQVSDTLEYDRKLSNSSFQMRNRMMMNRDSMFRHRMNFSKEKMDSFRMNSMNRIQEMERTHDFHNQRMFKIQNLQFTGKDSDIAVFDVVIKTERGDTMEFYISKDFRVLGPKFMFEKNPYRGRMRRF